MWWLVIPAAIGGGALIKKWLDEEYKKRVLLEQIKTLLEQNKRNRRIAPFLEGLLERSGEYTAEQLAVALEAGIQELDPDIIDTILDFLAEIFGSWS